MFTPKPPPAFTENATEFHTDFVAPKKESVWDIEDDREKEWDSERLCEMEV